MRRAPRYGTPIISYCDICSDSIGKTRVYKHKGSHLCLIHWKLADDAERSRWYEGHVDKLTDAIENEFNTGD